MVAAPLLIAGWFSFLLCFDDRSHLCMLVPAVLLLSKWSLRFCYLRFLRLMLILTHWLILLLLGRRRSLWTLSFWIGSRVLSYEPLRWLLLMVMIQMDLCLLIKYLYAICTLIRNPISLCWLQVVAALLVLERELVGRGSFVLKRLYPSLWVLINQMVWWGVGFVSGAGSVAFRPRSGLDSVRESDQVLRSLTQMILITNLVTDWRAFEHFTRRLKFIDDLHCALWLRIWHASITRLSTFRGLRSLFVFR